MKNRALRVLLAGPVLAVACSEASETPLTPEPLPTSSAALVATAPNMKELTRSLTTLSAGIAVAVEEGTVRSEVLRVLRASPYVEHKVVLSELLASNSVLLEAFSQGAQMSPGDYLDLARRTASLDFYVPGRDHRMTWRATPDIRVAFTVDQNRQEVTVVGANGSRVSTNGRSSQRPLLVLHPAEMKHERDVRQKAVEGSVIQDPDDGSVGSSITVTGARPRFALPGSIARLGRGPAEVAQDCEPESETCGGDPGGGTTDYVLFEGTISDFGDGIGDAELEYTVHDGSGRTGVVRITGVSPGYFKAPAVADRAMFTAPLTGGSGSDNVSVEETDAFSNDFWGYGTLGTGHNDVYRNTVGFCADIGDPATSLPSECDVSPYVTRTTRFRVSW